MAERPNVIVFFTDQQRWDTSGLHGNPMDLMPNFERMARRGTHFAQSITCQPVCGPARSCMQTGFYATQTGVFKNHLPLFSSRLPTLAEHFNDAGYTTGYIGKWHLGGTRVSFDRADQEPVPQERRGGYQHWLGADLLEFSSDAYDCVLFDENDRAVKLPGYRVDAMTDAAIRYVDEHRREPFFLFLSFLEPHHQNTRDDYPAPPGYEERYRSPWIPPDLATLGGSAHYQLPGYYGMVKRLDECLGRLLDALTSLGLDENTVVLFSSDHGNHFKTRNPEYKRSEHESSVRVPTAAQGPGFDGGGTVEELFSLIDIPPTLLDAAGIEQKKEMMGHSVLPLLHDRTVPWQDDVYIEISESKVGRALRTGRWKYSVSAPEKDPMEDAAAERYREDCLYDLFADPYELVNLAGATEYREVADRLKERLLRRMKESGEGSAEIVDAPGRSVPGQRQVWPEELDR